MSAFLDPDTLRGHEDRIKKLHKMLKTYYDAIGDVQYFKSIGCAPKLSEVNSSSFGFISEHSSVSSNITT